MTPEDLDLEQQAAARRKLQAVFALLSMVHNVRYGHDDTQRCRIDISPILGPGERPAPIAFPYTAIDRLHELALTEVEAFRTENRKLGYTEQIQADRAIAKVDQIIDAGNNPEALRAKARGHYAAAAALAAQPDGLEEFLNAGPPDPTA